MRSQRLQDNRQWPNPIVVKLTNVEPALVPPRVKTGSYVWDEGTGSYLLKGELLAMGEAESLDVGFEYRSIEGEDIHSRTAPWIAMPTQITKARAFLGDSGMAFQKTNVTSFVKAALREASFAFVVWWRCNAA